MKIKKFRNYSGSCTEACTVLSSGTASPYTRSPSTAGLVPPNNTCTCQCNYGLPTFREDLRICVNDIHGEPFLIISRFVQPFFSFRSRFFFSTSLHEARRWPIPISYDYPVKNVVHATVPNTSRSITRNAANLKALLQYAIDDDESRDTYPILCTQFSRGPKAPFPEWFHEFTNTPYIVHDLIPIRSSREFFPKEASPLEISINRMEKKKEKRTRRSRLFNDLASRGFSTSGLA